MEHFLFLFPSHYQHLASLEVGIGKAQVLGRNRKIFESSALRACCVPCVLCGAGDVLRELTLIPQVGAAAAFPPYAVHRSCSSPGDWIPRDQLSSFLSLSLSLKKPEFASLFVEERFPAHLSKLPDNCSDIFSLSMKRQHSLLKQLPEPARFLVLQSYFQGTGRPDVNLVWSRPDL